MSTTMGTGVPPEWELHPQLAADTVCAGNLPLAQVLVHRDANFPWLVLVPRRPGAVEIIDLDVADQHQLTDEVARVAKALRVLTQCDKLNVAAIGNVVPQLHVHIVARRRTDPAWPRPVWGVVPARAYDPAELAAFVAAVRAQFNF
jgi:diadenosine tetraphosphate (Ap4A) HIT family hydrolase